MAYQVEGKVGNEVRRYRAPSGYHMRELRPSDVPALYELHQLIISRLSDPDAFRESPLEFYASHTGQEGRTFGVFLDKQIVAYALLRFPASMPDNLGINIGVPADQLALVAHLEECAVHPSHRGQGFQLALTKMRIEEAIAEQYRHLALTISPLNPFSLRNHLSLGLSVKALARKYGGKIRLILHKDAAEKPSTKWQRTAEIDLADTAALAAHLAEGQWGHAVRVVGERTCLILGKRSS